MSSAPALVLDFETYYDNSGYSLGKKMTIPEYVADSRFHVHGVAIRLPGGVKSFRPDAGLALRQLQQEYGESFKEVVTVAHNFFFDGYILFHKYGIKVANPVCTQQLSYFVNGKRDKGVGEAASLEHLSQKYGLEAKKELEFMRGVVTPTPQQLIQLAEYAKTDVELEFQIANILLPKVTNLKTELPLLQHTLNLFIQRKVRVNVPELKGLRQDVRDHVKKSFVLLREHIKTAGLEVKDADITPEAISKNKKFPELLGWALARTGRKIALKQGTNSLIPATAKTDEAMQALLLDDDPIVSALASARLNKKSESQLIAKLDTLERIATVTGGYLPPCLYYCGASPTARFAGAGKFNLQNLGKKGFGLRMRQLLLPEVGHRFVISDFAAIEARVLSWIAGQEDLTQAFKENRDIYSETAAVAFRREVRKPVPTDSPEAAKALKVYREVGKTIILGLGYSLGAIKLSNTLKANPLTAYLFEEKVLSLSVCKALVDQYRNTYTQIPKLWRETEACFMNAIRGQASEYRGLVFKKVDDVILVFLPSGRAMRYPNCRLELVSKKFKYVEGNVEAESEMNKIGIMYGSNVGLYGGKLVENICQAIARDILGESILRLEKKGLRVLFHAHDENIVEVLSADAPWALEVVENEMAVAPDWAKGMAIGCEAGIADRYSK